MMKFGTYETHARLVERMADAMGVDLTERAQRVEDLSETEARNRVHRCQGCTAPETCVTFLDGLAQAGDKAPSAPDFCRNGDELARVAAE
ncbi:DUF6455 family protein [Celeribacter sp.]|uniref:DUF6455 family protein n=1 Tax=Celeribacter sp. TaxID=1890673 RepID=UPI003A93B713